VTDLGGFAEPGYGPVADAPASTFDHGDPGAGCALFAFSHVINRMVVTPEVDRRTAALMAAVREWVDR